VQTGGLGCIAVNGWFWNSPETGSGQYVRRLVQALPDLDSALELKILLPAPPVEPVGPSGRVDTVVHVTAPTGLNKLRWEQVSVPWLARKVGANLLHVPYWAPPAAAPLPVVVTVHDIIPLVLPGYRGSAKVRLYTALVSAATARAQLVLTDSEASRLDILHHLRIPEERVRSIPLALDATYTPDASSDDAALRDAWGLTEPYILYLGGFDRRKNLETVMAAFAIVHRARPDARLVIAGRLPEHDTAFTPDPRRLAREVSLPSNVIDALGFVPERDKPALYRGAAALVFPSLYEGFGYPPLEAITCGTPVVGSNTASLPEVVGNGGVLLSPEDTPGIAGALLQILSDPSFRARLRASAIEHSRSFSWKRTATATLDAFREVMDVNLCSPKKKTMV
jgi:glycosyltransferase involved in cell wall biosynthesis